MLYHVSKEVSDVAHKKNKFLSIFLQLWIIKYWFSRCNELVGLILNWLP